MSQVKSTDRVRRWRQKKRALNPPPPRRPPKTPAQRQKEYRARKIKAVWLPPLTDTPEQPKIEQSIDILQSTTEPTTIVQTSDDLISTTQPTTSRFILPKTVKGQWKALKDTYRKEAKKVINDPNYHSSWAKLEPMSFIHDQLGLENNVDPLSDQNSSQSFVQQENKIEFVYENVPDTANNGENFATSSRGVKRKVEASEECSTNEEVEDEDWYFFKSLMPHIKQLSPQRKMLMRMKIMETVYKEVYSYDLQE